MLVTLSDASVLSFTPSACSITSPASASSAAANVSISAWLVPVARCRGHPPAAPDTAGCATQFILDPLYKIYSQVLGEPESTVRAMLSEFGVYLKPSAYRQDVKPLLKDACASIFGSATGLTDMMVRHFPSARAASAAKVCLFRTSWL